MTLGELYAEIGKGQLLAASPKECFLVDRDGKIGLNIEPSLCRRLIQQAGFHLCCLPQYDWFDNGRCGWRGLVPIAVADNYARCGFDFFVLTQ
jgi:hypothetical protein